MGHVVVAKNVKLTRLFEHLAEKGPGMQIQVQSRQLINTFKENDARPPGGTSYATLQRGTAAARIRTSSGRAHARKWSVASKLSGVATYDSSHQLL